MSIERLREAIKPCKLEGTSHTESGVKVSVKPDKSQEETIVFFCIDPESPESNEDCEFIDIISAVQICDLLIDYESSKKVVFCLVELKGRDVEHAIEQVLSTFKGILRTFGKNVRDDVQWKAYIVQHGSAPCPTKKSQKLLRLMEEAFSQFDDFEVKKDRDVGRFLRK